MMIDCDFVGAGIDSLFFTKREYEEEARNGYIKIHRHPLFPNLVLLNYTEHTTFERHWNKVTLASRGLIVDELTGEVVALPFNKFFNYGEMEVVPIPHGKPEVTIKQDGSLGIMYRANGKICWATRGSFTSEQAVKAQEIWDKKYSHLNDHFLNKVPHLTLIVEIIYPENRIVTDYGDVEDLIIIGARNRFTGEDYSYEKLELQARLTQMPITHLVEISLEQALENKKTLVANEEGYVLNWNGYRLKVKGDQYLDVHRLMYGISDKRKFELAVKGELDVLIRELPEEFRPELEEFEVMIQFIRVTMLIAITAMFMDLSEIVDKSDRKAFALEVNESIQPEFKQFMFLLLDNKDIEPSLDEMLIKKYRDYMPILN